MVKENGLHQMMVLRDNAKEQLEQIKSVEDGISYLNKLSAIDVWVKAEKKDAELQNIVAEQKLRTQRILGELLTEGQRKGMIVTPKDTLKKGSVIPDNDNGKKKLSDYDLTANQSSAFQQIASIPEETFEQFIQEKKQAVNNAVSELTTTGAMKLAKSLQEKKSELHKMQSLDHRMAIEKELKEIAAKVNKTYTKEQRIYFITLIKQ